MKHHQEKITSQNNNGAGCVVENGGHAEINGVTMDNNLGAPFIILNGTSGSAKNCEISENHNEPNKIGNDCNFTIEAV